MNRINNAFNYTPKVLGERFTKDSKTTPNMTLSLKVLLQRFTRGQEVDLKQPQFSDELTPTMKMDKISKIELLDQLYNTTASLARNIEAEKIKKQQAEALATAEQITDATITTTQSSTVEGDDK